MPGNLESRRVEYAAPWRRVGGAMVDGALLPIAASVGRMTTFGRLSFGAVFELAYFVIATGLWGRTVGKALFGTKVVRTNGSRVDFGVAALREVLGKFVCHITLGIGYLIALWDDRNQGLHDKIAGTVVVRAGRRAPKLPPGSPPTLEARPETWTVSGVDVKEAVRSSVDRVIRTASDRVASSVQRERPDLRAQAGPDGTVTMMFTDASGVAELTDSYGDSHASDLFGTYREVVQREVAAHHGYEVKSTGDGFMVAFSSARRAVQCAIAIQRSMAAQARDDRIHATFGLHTGEVVRDSGDFFGRNVVIAARIADLADPGQILVSSVVKELTESGGDIQFSPPREVELKELTGTYRVFEVSW
jgi:class 3 adenylate cyclase/uncharacterized RDD family membrane protein YckC